MREKQTFHIRVIYKFMLYFEYIGIWHSGAQVVEEKHNITKEILQYLRQESYILRDSQIVYKFSLT